MGDTADPDPAPPVAPILLAVFWLLIGAAAGIKLTQGLWPALGLDAGCRSPSRSGPRSARWRRSW